MGCTTSGSEFSLYLPKEERSVVCNALVLGHSRKFELQPLNHSNCILINTIQHHSLPAKGTSSKVKSKRSDEILIQEGGVGAYAAAIDYWAIH